MSYFILFINFRVDISIFEILSKDLCFIIDYVKKFFIAKPIIIRCQRTMLRTDLVSVESPTAHGHTLVGPFVLELQLLDLLVREAHYVRW